MSLHKPHRTTMANGLLQDMQKLVVDSLGVLQALQCMQYSSVTNAGVHAQKFRLKEFLESLCAAWLVIRLTSQVALLRRIRALRPAIGLPKRRACR